jgi:hypothetical protein
MTREELIDHRRMMRAIMRGQIRPGEGGSMSKGEHAEIREMNAADLVGRLVTNTHGAQFVVTHLSFMADTASVVIWIAGVDEDTGRWGEPEAGLERLRGWTIHHKLTGGTP